MVEHERTNGDREAIALARVMKRLTNLAQPLERDAAIEQIGRVAAESIDADLGFVGLLGSDSKLRLEHVHGGQTNALVDLCVERGCGLGGKVLLLGQVASVEDYAVSNSISHEYDEAIAREGMRGVLCLPLSVGDELLGVAYVSNRTPTVYSDVMVDNVLTAVEAAKLAVSVADRSRELTEAAVQLERERTVSTLDATVSGHLQQILAVAEKIAADPNSSQRLIDQARSIASSADNACTAFRKVADTPNSTTQESAPSQPLTAILSRRELCLLYTSDAADE